MSVDDTRASPSILFVMAGLEPSGAESMLLSLSALLRRDGIRGIVLSTGEGGVGSFGATLAAAGYQIEHLPFTRSPGFVRDFWRLCRRLRPTAIHIHCERANVWLGLAARLAAPGARVVRTIHAVFAFGGLLRLRRMLQRALLRWSGVVTIAHSAAVAETERRQFANPVHIIAPWIDLTRFAPITPAQRQAARDHFGLTGTAPIVAVVGSCQPVKNHDLLLEALAGGASDIDYVVLHAGTGPCEQQERGQALQLGLEGKVRFLGPVGDVRQVLAASDLFVMPSQREGFGLAALEALACGVPALLSSGSGLESFSGFGEAVFWCRPDREALAERLRSLLSTPAAQLRVCAAAAPALAGELFSAEKSWQRHKELYALPGGQDISCRPGL